MLLDGLTRSELRRLLGNAADVDSLRRQLDKAHGHEHNEDGTIKGGGSETGGASPRHTDAAGDHQLKS